MTLDLGTGPVTLIEMRHRDEHTMLRVQHRAIFGSVKEVEPEQARAYVASIQGASMSDTVSPEHESRLSDEIAKWAEPRGERVHRVRWHEGKYGKILATPEDLEHYDAANAGVAAAPVQRRSSRIML